MVSIAMPSTISSSSSDIASFIEERRKVSFDLLQGSNALGFAAKGTFQQLDEVFKECDSEGWDGERAKAISTEVLQCAERFLKSFPLGIKAPDVGAESDGAITFEWYQSPDKVVSVSINPDGWVYYAALLGTSKRHGSDYSLMGVSDDLLRIILRVTGKY
jgi:hypothetical protein